MYRQSPVKSPINHKVTIKQINWNFVNESEPIYLGPLETKAYTTNGTRTVYVSHLNLAICKLAVEVDRIPRSLHYSFPDKNNSIAIANIFCI